MRNMSIFVNGLTKIYKPYNIKALDNISFSISENIMFSGVAGPNGAGKTTLLNIVNTLLDFDSGDVRVLGYDVKTEKHKIRKRLSMVFQEHAIDSLLNVEENIIFIARLRGYNLNESRQIAKEILEFFDLWDFRRKPVMSLSGGMMRRLQLARAFIGNPEIIILDEPTLGIDPIGKRDIWIRLKKKVLEAGARVFIATNDMEEAEFLLEKIVFLYKGQIIEIGSAKELINKYCGLTVIEVMYNEPVNDSFETCLESLLGKKLGFIKVREKSYVIIGVRENISINDALEYVKSCAHNPTSLKIRRALLSDVFEALIKV